MANRLATVVVGVLLSTLVMGGARADAIGLAGTLDASSPTMPVVFISDPRCTGQGATPVHYAVHSLLIAVPGVHSFSLTSPSNFASFVLYITSFDPTKSLIHCIAADNSGSPKAISFGLDEFNDYHLVVFDDTFAQAGGDYQVTIDEPTTTTTTTTTTTSTTTTSTTTTSTTTTTLPRCVAAATFESVACRLAELRDQAEADVVDARFAGKLSGTLTKARTLVRLAEALASDARKARRGLAKALRAIKRFDKLLASPAGQQTPSAVRDGLLGSSGAIQADISLLVGG